MDEEMKTALCTEVDLGPGHIVLDGVPALRERGTAAPLFSAHVYCGHGRRSQLLLSSCHVTYCNLFRHFYVLYFQRPHVNVKHSGLGFLGHPL